MTEVEVLGDYLLIEKIGTGGMARTFKALSVHASTHVCLKVLHPHLADDEHNVRMFIDEANICKELNHPNIVRLFDYGKVDEHWYIALELVLGEDLKTVLDDARERHIRLRPTLCAEIVIGLLRALDYIHNKRVGDTRLEIIHRDVTPHNLMLPFEGGVKLTDFGVAKAAFRLSRTSTGAIKGKYGYMSPEQVRSNSEIDARSDVFAAGIMLHEMLTDRHLFQGETPYITIANLISMPVEAPSRFNSRVDDVLDRTVMKALERDRERRYPSARAMLADLESWSARRAMEGDSADVGQFVRELYGLESEKPQGPRRVTSEELAAMVAPDSRQVYESHPDEPPIRITRSTGEISIHDQPLPDDPSVLRPQRRMSTGPHLPPRLTGEHPPDPLAELLDEVLSEHVSLLSLEIPIDVEDVSAEATPSREINITVLERSGGLRALEARTGRDHTATEASPLELPTQEVHHLPSSHLDGDPDQTREVVLRPSISADRTLREAPDDTQGLAVSALPPGMMPREIPEAEEFATTEIAAENLRDSLASDASQGREPPPKEQPTLVMRAEDVQAELARALRKPRS